ncbi:MAG TPA: hypothetical protein PKZ32_12975, partial [Candidatus Melainabacteria bacterium]|nr:hypothetical protein [Candidatus Melainabacteria bacterium]
KSNVGLNHILGNIANSRGNAQWLYTPTTVTYKSNVGLNHILGNIANSRGDALTAFGNHLLAFGGSD